MADTITFSFTPEKQDYVKSLRAFYFHMRNVKIMVGIFFLASLCTIPLLLSNQPSFTGFIFPAITICYILFLFFITPERVGNSVKKNERLNCETTWVVDENQVSIKNKFGDTNFDWGTLGKVFETRDHLLITYSINKNVFQIVPKRAFQSPQQESQFRKILEEKLYHIVPIGFLNPKEFIWFIIPIAVILLLNILMVILLIMKFQ